ncbi:MAG: hypothetical protein HYS81_03330 [Candidatus Aenigmatarchaeota archaeon]|nr:MAG: hypothetical protein HYS81_03330 [Candidatus Aenigmarchaeota archaeon]
MAELAVARIAEHGGIDEETAQQLFDMWTEENAGGRRHCWPVVDERHLKGEPGV